MCICVYEELNGVTIAKVGVWLVVGLFFSLKKKMNKFEKIGKHKACRVEPILGISTTKRERRV